jgi:hypothetical protein
LEVKRIKPRISPGIRVFSTLLVVWAAFNLMSMTNVEDWNYLNQPLPEVLIQANYIITVFFITLGLISGVGILFLKESFRKIVIVTAFFTLFTYLIEGPLLIYPNLGGFIAKQTAIVAAEAPDLSIAGIKAALWMILIFGYVLEFGFALSLVYFFTRPKVKKQFK